MATCSTRGYISGVRTGGVDNEDHTKTTYVLARVLDSKKGEKERDKEFATRHVKLRTGKSYPLLGVPMTSPSPHWQRLEFLGSCETPSLTPPSATRPFFSHIRSGYAQMYLLIAA